MAKPKVKEVIVVEGRYDKNTLSQVVDAVIVELGGFAVFNDQGKAGLFAKARQGAGHHPLHRPRRRGIRDP